MKPGEGKSRRVVALRFSLTTMELIGAKRSIKFPVGWDDGYRTLVAVTAGIRTRSALPGDVNTKGAY